MNDIRFNFIKTFGETNPICHKCHNYYKIMMVGSEYYLFCEKCNYSIEFESSTRLNHMYIFLVKEINEKERYYSDYVVRFEGDEITKQYYFSNTTISGGLRNKNILVSGDLDFSNFKGKDFIDFAFKLYENKEFI